MSFPNSAREHKVRQPLVLHLRHQRCHSRSMGEDEEECCPCCACSRKCQDRCLVFVVCCIIVFVYSSYYIVVAIPFGWFYSVIGLINLLLFNCVTVLLVISYYRAITTSPGFAPKGWVCVLFWFLSLLCSADPKILEQKKYRNSFSTIYGRCQIITNKSKKGFFNVFWVL
jgi:hypothetical protein